MRILIIGSEGFIGSHLGRELQDSGHQVGNMDVALGAKGDARKIDNVLAAIENHKAEIVVHLAAKVGPESAEDDVLLTAADGGMTAVIAQACGLAGVRLVYGSAAEVYGRVTRSENDGFPNTPTNIYGLVKNFGESIGNLYAPDGFTSLRFSNPYGAGVTVGRSSVIDLLWQAKYGKPMLVPIGDERSWCWIGDTVRAARLVIEKGEGPYNIGRDDDNMSVQAIAELACILTGADKGLIEMVPSSQNQPRLSTQRLRSLGWHSTTSIYDGMTMTLETWVEHLEEDGSFARPELEVV